MRGCALRSDPAKGDEYRWQDRCSVCAAKSALRSCLSSGWRAAESHADGYCLTCAKELGIKPVDDLMKQFGITDQDLEQMEDRFSAFMQNGGAEAMEGMMENDDGEEETEEEDFTPGGSATFPFNLMGRMGGAQDAEYHPVEGGKTALLTEKRTPVPGKREKKEKIS